MSLSTRHKQLNKMEHRLFCHITRNWRGVPLETHEIVVNLVSSTRTSEGLEVHCWLDETNYKTGRKVSQSQMGERKNSPQLFSWRLELRNTPTQVPKAVSYLRTRTNSRTGPYER